MSSWDSHFAIKQTVRPSGHPVSLGEVKDHCRVQHDLEDGLITQYIAAATKYVEAHLRKQLLTATWQLKLDNWPCVTEANPWGAILVPRPPLQSVSSITYLDSAGDSQTWSSANYSVDTASEPGRVTPVYGVAYPTVRTVPNAITVTYVAGYTAAALVPATMRTAVAMLAANWYENREPVVTGTIATKIPMHIDILLAAESLGDLVC